MKKWLLVVGVLLSLLLLLFAVPPLLSKPDTFMVILGFLLFGLSLFCGGFLFTMLHRLALKGGK